MLIPVLLLSESLTWSKLSCFVATCVVGHRPPYFHTKTFAVKQKWCFTFSTMIMSPTCMSELLTWILPEGKKKTLQFSVFDVLGCTCYFQLYVVCSLFKHTFSENTLEVDLEYYKIKHRYRFVPDFLLMLIFFSHLLTDNLSACVCAVSHRGPISVILPQ